MSVAGMDRTRRDPEGHQERQEDPLEPAIGEKSSNRPLDMECISEVVRVVLTTYSEDQLQELKSGRCSFKTWRRFRTTVKGITGTGLALTINFIKELNMHGLQIKNSHLSGNVFAEDSNVVNSQDLRYGLQSEAIQALVSLQSQAKDITGQKVLGELLQELRKEEPSLLQVRRLWDAVKVLVPQAAKAGGVLLTYLRQLGV